MSQKNAKSFEYQITKLSLLIASAPLLVLMAYLLLSTGSIYLKVIILLFLAFFIAIGALFIWQKVRNQLRTTTNIVEALISGDSTMRPSSAVESGALAELNLVLNTALKSLAEHRMASKEHQLAMVKVLEHINVAVISTDENGAIVLLNPEAKKMFSITDAAIGSPINTLGISKEFLNSSIQQVVSLNTEAINKRVYLQTDTYHLSGKVHTLLFFNDVQKLLQDEERVAWQRLLRVLRHEINNSLAPIASISESLSMVVAEGDFNEETQDDLKEGLSIITKRALALDSFIKEYQMLTKLPSPTKSVFSLGAFVKEQVELFPEVQVSYLTEQDIEVFADMTQLAQALVNVLKNAKQACLSKNCELTIEWQVSDNLLLLKIKDNGQGISNPDNLFVPFYTTKSDGSGIGLVLSRQILFNHGGDLTLTNRSDQQGAEATFWLPMID